MLSVEGAVAQFLIRKIDERVKARVQRRAKRNGRSVEAELREMIANASQEEETPAGGLGSEMVALFSGQGIWIDEPIPEIRGMRMEIPDFK
jgi:plasmid stability protein